MFLLELINDYPQNSKEITVEYLQDKIDDPSTKLREDLNKALIPYIRHEKLNKLIKNKLKNLKLKIDLYIN